MNIHLVITWERSAVGRAEPQGKREVTTTNMVMIGRQLVGTVKGPGPKCISFCKQGLP